VVLGLQSHDVLPALLPLVLIHRIGVITTVFLLLLGHQRALLQLELDFFGLGGKSHDEELVVVGLQGVVLTCY
jgi:hypothetical protein